MHVVPPPCGCGTDRLGAALLPGLTIAALGIPMVIAMVALVPPLMICPFLSTAHQRFVLRLLASLRQWTLIISRAAQVATERHPQKPPTSGRPTATPAVALRS